MKTLAVVLFLACATVSRAQTPTAAPVPPGAIGAAQSTTLAQGWTALAQGDVGRADTIARQALGEDPTNPSAIALAVEVSLARSGWQAGLDTYEQWRGNRSAEAVYVLRRVARGALLDALSSSPDPGIRAEAARGLADGGEPGVAAAYRAKTGGEHPIDKQTLAALGDPAAVAAVAEALQAGAGDRLALTRALAASRSERAIEPLINQLANPRPELVAAAAEGLGQLDARAAIPKLKALLGDPVPATRIAAAASLYQMQDYSGSSLLQKYLSSEVGAMRLQAARAFASNPDGAWQATVHSLLNDPDPVVQIGAARLLAPHNPTAARAAVDRLTRDQNIAVREEAQRTLPVVLGDDFGTLRSLLRSPDQMVRVRSAGRILALTR